MRMVVAGFGALVALGMLVAAAAMAGGPGAGGFSAGAADLDLLRAMQHRRVRRTGHDGERSLDQETR